MIIINNDNDNSNWYFSFTSCELLPEMWGSKPNGVAVIVMQVIVFFQGRESSLRKEDLIK